MWHRTKHDKEISTQNQCVSLHVIFNKMLSNNILEEKKINSLILIFFLMIHSFWFSKLKMYTLESQQYVRSPHLGGKQKNDSFSGFSKILKFRIYNNYFWLYRITKRVDALEQLL